MGGGGWALGRDVEPEAESEWRSVAAHQTEQAFGREAELAGVLTKVVAPVTQDLALVEVVQVVVHGSLLGVVQISLRDDLKDQAFLNLSVAQRVLAVALVTEVKSCQRGYEQLTLRINIVDQKRLTSPVGEGAGHAAS